MTPETRSSSRGFYAVLVASALYLALVLNRWAFTELGPASFGRVWHLFVSYWDFGVIRRSLLGTVLDTLQARALFANDYHYAYTVHLAQLAAAFGFVTLVLRRGSVPKDAGLAAIVLASPAFLLQAAYTTGSQDVTILLLVLLAVFYAPGLAAATLLCLVGLLIHEIFLFCVPLILVLHALAPCHRDDRAATEHLRRSLIPLAIIAAAFVVISQGGRVAMDQAAFEAIMAARMPDAAGIHPLWSGYFEVSSGAAANMSAALGQSLSRHWAYLLLPIAYCALLCAFATRAFRSHGIVAQALVALSTLTPLVITLVATDVYRWIGLSASLSLVALLQALTWGGAAPRHLVPILLPFSLLAPFGAYPWERPFPVHQAVLERWF
ncbi:MAG TPA: hypothetical protein VIL09_09375 [Microvirga sp.]|jgi:hypothetical protein